MATMFVMKLLFLFSITMVTLESVNGQIGMAHIVALLKHISDTSEDTSATLPQLVALLQNQADTQAVNKLLLENNTATSEKIETTQTQMAKTLSQVGATQSQMANTLTRVEDAQNQTGNTLTRIETSQVQMSKTLTEIAATQKQTANAFNQVVNLLERQGQQLQNMTMTLSSVVSVLENQQNIPNDCSEINSRGVFSTGRYVINPSNCPFSFNVGCDMHTDEGGWTIFQKRFDGTIDFFRSWDDYERGFGNLDGEYWMGLSQIHCMTQTGNWQLRIDMEAFNGDVAYALYESFSVGNASTNYQLNIGTYNGTAGDSLATHNHMAFSTKDRDNDGRRGDCANFYMAAWWYNDCHLSNLNGLYLGPTGESATGNVWWHWKLWQSLKRTEMKMRRAQ